jgi:uncharacterized protein with NAD-binding domain and iron-sulfur cluster
MRPGVESLRLPQQTTMENLLLAGDWTRTGWPATMESAVRSGYLAAEAILRKLNNPQRFLVPDLGRTPENSHVVFEQKVTKATKT